MDMAAHQDVQLLVVLVCLALIIYLATRISPEPAHVAGKSVRARPDHGSGQYVSLLSAGLVILCIGLPQIGSVFTDSAHDKQIKTVAKGSPDFPGTLSVRLSDRITLMTVSNPDMVDRIPERLLKPERQRNGKGWAHSATAKYRDCKAQQCVEFMHLTWHSFGDDDLIHHTYYTYFVGDLTTPSRLRFRLQKAWSKLTDGASPNGMIVYQVSGQLPDQFSLPAYPLHVALKEIPGI